MKKLVLSIIAVMVLFSVGCSKNNEYMIKDELTQMKKMAWESLSKKEQKVVVSNWESAEIKKIELSKLPSIVAKKQPTNVYRITFKTTQDEMLGPIAIYIDADTKEIVGYDPKD